MCCGKICTFCVILVALVITIGCLFGFGVFKHGFHKAEDAMHLCDPSSLVHGTSLCKGGRPFLAPPPSYTSP